jgi:mannan endo-1,4-beta-mannosidase
VKPVMPTGVDSYDAYFPGDDVVDILGTDIYHTGFAKEQYDQLLALAKNKPIAPTPEILKEQSRWTWFMLWGDPPDGGTNGQTIRAAYNCDQAITFDKLPWVQSGQTQAKAPFTP